MWRDADGGMDDTAAMSFVAGRQLRWLLGFAAVTYIAFAELPMTWSTHATFAFAAAAACAAPDLRSAAIAAWIVASGVGLAAVLGAPIHLGAAGAAGASAGWRADFPTDWRDALHGGLAAFGLAGLSLVWVTRLGVPAVWAQVAWGTAVALATSFALWAPAWRHDRPEALDRSHFRTLRPPYRARATRAAALYTEASRMAPDVRTRRGLHEVAVWVFRLQQTRDRIDRELSRLDPDQLALELGESGVRADDEFTRERQLATRSHLGRLRQHHCTMRGEAERARTLVDYALAFLEDARVSLVMGELKPGQGAPSELSEVLRRLRGHAISADASERTRRELVGVGA